MGGARFAPTASVALALLVAMTSLGAQPQTPSPLPDTPPATRSVSGRLVDAVTGDAISGGMLVLRELVSRDQYVATTEADGRFTVADLPEADYHLHASAIGYVGRQSGQRHALEAGEQIALAAGEARNGLDIALIPGAVITGRVTTENGQPLALAEVEALRPQLENNLRVLLPVGRAESDVNGRFRISGLPPGHYYIAAIDPADEGTEDIAGQVHWDQTFYPGVQTAAEANRVRLDSGDTVTSVDFAMLGVTRVNVMGRLFNPDEDELATGSIIMSPESDDGLGVGMAHAGIVRPDGTFEFLNVSPGAYRLRASARTVQPGPALFASFLLSVGDRDVSNAVLFLNPGASLFGEVEVADGASSEPPSMTEIWVSAPMADGAMGSGLTRSRSSRTAASAWPRRTGHEWSDWRASPIRGHWTLSTFRAATSSTCRSTSGRGTSENGSGSS